MPKSPNNIRNRIDIEHFSQLSGYHCDVAEAEESRKPIF